MPAPVLQFKRGNAGVAGTVPALRPGEPAISLNNFDLFIGINTSVANNKFFGSHRYWAREDGTNSLSFKLVDKDGTNYVAIKAPNTLVGIVTYTLPGTQGATSSVLTNDGGGNLVWAPGVSAATVNTNTTTSDQNYYIPFVTNGIGTTSETVRVGAALSVNPSTNTLSIATIKTSTIQSANTGANAITLAGNDVNIIDDLTVGGNLYVNGNTTQINTTSLTVEDRTIDLGIVDGAPPSQTTTWDLGVLFNYYTSGTAKKSAVVWEHGDSRFKFASVLDVDTNGTDVNTPQLTVATFAPIEISALWVNDCAGQSQVISCTGTERFIKNITMDAGNY
jgi:hypothetical protein